MSVSGPVSSLDPSQARKSAAVGPHGLHSLPADALLPDETDPEKPPPDEEEEDEEREAELRRGDEAYQRRVDRELED